MFSFGANAGSYLALKDASPGDVFDIEVVKNDAGFNDWVVAKKLDGVAAPNLTPSASSTSISTGKSGFTPAPKSTYPTEDERAKTQIYIVRQSNLNTAVATLAVGAKSVKPEDVIKTAKLYEDHVFGTSSNPVAPAVTFDVTTAFDDLDDFPIN